MVKILVWYGVWSCKCECEPLMAMCDFSVTPLKMTKYVWYVGVLVKPLVYHSSVVLEWFYGCTENN